MRLEPHLRSGYLVRAETPAALARALGIDPAGSSPSSSGTTGTPSAARIRSSARGRTPTTASAGSDAHAEPEHRADLTPPYYAVRLVPGDLGTFIGLATDPLARVLDVNERPIPGLYAVGNDQASVMGGTYPGAGITIGPAMTFGYIAARDLAG